MCPSIPGEFYFLARDHDLRPAYANSFFAAHTACRGNGGVALTRNIENRIARKCGSGLKLYLEDFGLSAADIASATQVNTGLGHAPVSDIASSWFGTTLVVCRSKYIIT